MSSGYPRGSEWRRWDLHVHVPGSKLSNGYGTNSDALDKFCDVINGSEVSVIGITDYFSVDAYFGFVEKFYEKYPDSDKVFFPNIELRLNESVNQRQEEVNLHIILPEDITKTKALDLLSKLGTEITDGEERSKFCSELDVDDYKSATVTRDSLKTAIKNTFGEKAIRQDKLLIITAANNDGIRPPAGKNRKLNISDQIDKLSDAYFGGSQNIDYFLDPDRLEDKDQKTRSKPVFSGSDAHSFDDLTNWLGKSFSSTSANKEITWVKANPTFEGLQQTLIEPAERVKIQDVKPDQKEPYKYISRVKFVGSKDFPEEIVFNSNLTSIIGSRSSGKSALLAYIAHTIDADDTISRQMDAQEERDISKIGPAAGKTWDSVSNIECKVEWAIGDSETGRLIYIPQNYLYSISKHPDEITEKIQPVLFTVHPDTSEQFEKTKREVSSANTVIRKSTGQWFDHEQSIKDLKSLILNLGDKKSIEAARVEYKNQIDELKKNLSLSQKDIEDYQAIVRQVTKLRARLTEIVAEKDSISPFYNSDNAPSIVNIHPSVIFNPTIDKLPQLLYDQISQVIDVSSDKLKEDIKIKILSYRKDLVNEEQGINKQIKDIGSLNRALIDKQQKNAQLTKLVESHDRQLAILGEIENKEKLIVQYHQKKKDLVQKITGSILERSQSHLNLSQAFSGIDQSKTEMDFGVEIGLNSRTIEDLSESFNRKVNSPYLSEGVTNLKKIRSEAENFLNYMLNSQKLRINQSPKQVAIAALCTTEDIRFNATLEGDKIGGFSVSSMTPGKQALFALTLILDESDDAWPLLIDQPEDDLDSRSIYDYIVPYLMERKKERQIIMVSHNANLVIGADSEEIIVANRNGGDRKNRSGKTFDYLSGAIEDSKEKTKATYVLESCGIREHAIDVLDGGKEAFEKRKNKYKI